MNMTSLAYVSTSRPGLSLAELRDIVSVAARRNAQANVTGGLLHLHGHFLQVLEGEHIKVFETFSRLMQDPRHSEVTLIGTGRVVERNFGDVWMGLTAPGALPKEVLKAAGVKVDFRPRDLTLDQLTYMVREACRSSSPEIDQVRRTAA
jgi:Sensors of blue-light using FAD